MAHTFPSSGFSFYYLYIVERTHTELCSKIKRNKPECVYILDSSKLTTLCFDESFAHSGQSHNHLEWFSHSLEGDEEPAAKAAFTWGSSSDFTQLPPETVKALYIFFHTCCVCV